MLRRCGGVCATFIPRSAWDPAHSNINWTDSYASDIAARRHWPAKRWSIGIEPRTPSDWLQFSYRNLAYAYNGALRACSTFPEMLVFFKEMKLRGVKMDVDTLSAMLSRAARFEHIQLDDIFLLFEEMVGLGARPDLSCVEILHTVYEHSVNMPAEWCEARRRQLVELYNYLIMEEIERLAPHHVEDLLAAQVQRVRDNLRQLAGSISPAVYRRYLATIESGDRLLREVHNFLWEFVQPDHPATDLPALQMRIPCVSSVMRRPKPAQLSAALSATTADAGNGIALADVKATDFEDSDVCSVFLAAVERCVDADLYDRQRQPYPQRRLYLSLLTMLTSSGVLYTRELMAQLMDVVKYSREDVSRDSDAMRLLRYAMRGSSSTAHGDAVYREAWQRIAPAVDARVVGRYVASRDPWSGVRLCCDAQLHFGSYPVPQLFTRRHDGDADVAGDKGKDDEDAAARGEAAVVASEAVVELKTANALRLRWDDIKQLVERTGVLHGDADRRGGSKVSDYGGSHIASVHLSAPCGGVRSSNNSSNSMSELKMKCTSGGSRNSDGCTSSAGVCGDADVTATAAMQATMEVFTGMAVFLRTAATGQRYGRLDDALATQAVDDVSGQAGGAGDLFAAGYSPDVWPCLLSCVQELRSMLERHIEAHEGHITPEFECWEAMVLTLRCILDYAVVNRQARGDAHASIDLDVLFRDAAQLRAQLVEEARTRFGGRMRILWLHEA